MPDISAEAGVREPGDMNLRGLWWLPEDPAKSVGGSLKFTHGQGGTLDLDGGLAGDAAPDTPVVIHGHAEGKPVTICDGRYRGHSVSRDTTTGSETITRESWTCFDAFQGFHSTDGSQQRFDSISMETAHLAQWVDRPHPDVVHESGGISLTIRRPETIEVELEDLGSLQLWWAETSTSGRLGAHVKLTPTLVLRPAVAMTREEAWTQFVTPILLFTTFALGTPDRITSLRAHVGDWAEPWSARQAEFFLTQWADTAPNITARWQGEYLLTFDDVENRMATVLPAWFSNFGRSHESFLDFFARSFTPFLYAEEEFVRVVRAMESWHRLAIGGTYMPDQDFSALLELVRDAVPPEKRDFLEMRLKHANERTLKQRLDALLEEAGEPTRSLVETYKRFARRVVETRNSLTHEGRLGDAFTDQELFWATKTLVHIFQSVLLRRLGYEADEVRTFVSRSTDWRWLSSARNPLADWSKFAPR